MPLIQCPSCGKTVASAASTCPGCREVLPRDYEKPKAQGIIFVVSSILGLGLAGILVLAVVTLQQPSSGGRTSSGTAAEPDPPQPSSVQPLPPEGSPAPPIETTQAPPTLPVQPQPNPVGSIPPSVQIRWTSDWANVRAGRTTQSESVDVIRPGERVEVDSLVGGWWAVYVDGRVVGYVHNSVLQGQPPEPGL